jgi:hypothetical protein
VGVRLGGVERTAGRGRVRAVGRRSCESCAWTAQRGAVARPDARTEYMYYVVTNTQTERSPNTGSIPA